MGEPETAVHRVGCQLERLLPDVVLHPLLVRQVLVLEQRLDGAPGLNQLPDLGRQHAGRRVPRGQLRNEVLVGGELLGGGPLATDRRETDVVLLQVCSSIVLCNCPLIFS